MAKAPKPTKTAAETIVEQLSKLQADTLLIQENLLQKLMAPFPDAAIERTDGKKTGKMYDTTGFGYQYVVNRLNNVFGVDGWHTEYEIEEIIRFQSKRGRDMWTVIMRVKIIFCGSEGECYRECWGSHTSSDPGDARKGAYTNGLKKTAGLLGVGWQAYADAIDDDNTPKGEDERGRSDKPNTQAVLGDRKTKAIKRMMEISELKGAEWCKSLVHGRPRKTAEDMEEVVKVLEYNLTKDAQTDDPKPGPESVTSEQAATFWKLVDAGPYTDEDVVADLESVYGVKDVLEMTQENFEALVSRYNVAAKGMNIDPSDPGPPPNDDVDVPF